jgi:hypothetical protein
MISSFLTFVAEETIPPGDAIIPRARLLELLAPSLTGKPLETMQSFLGTALPTRGVTWANGQAVVTEDWPGMRKMGSGFCKRVLCVSQRLCFQFDLFQGLDI